MASGQPPDLMYREVGSKTASTPAVVSIAMSVSLLRGYLSKSSSRENCARSSERHNGTC